MGTEDKKQATICGRLSSFIIWAFVLILFVGALLVIVWAHEDYTEYPDKVDSIRKHIERWDQRTSAEYKKVEKKANDEKENNEEKGKNDTKWQKEFEKISNEVDGLKSAQREELLLDITLESAVNATCPVEFKPVKNAKAIGGMYPEDMYPTRLINKEDKLVEYEQFKYAYNITGLGNEAFDERCQLKVVLKDGARENVEVATVNARMKDEVALTYQDMQCDQECLCQQKILSKDICSSCVDPGKCRKFCDKMDSGGYDPKWRTCGSITAPLRTVCFAIKYDQGARALKITSTGNPNTKILATKDPYFNQRRVACTVDASGRSTDLCDGSEQKCYDFQPGSTSNPNPVRVIIRAAADPWVFYSDNVHSFAPPTQAKLILLPIAMTIIALVGFMLACCAWPISKTGQYIESKAEKEE